MNFVEEMDCRVFGSTGRRLLSFLYLVWTVWVIPSWLRHNWSGTEWLNYPTCCQNLDPILNPKNELCWTCSADYFQVGNVPVYNVSWWIFLARVHSCFTQWEWVEDDAITQTTTGNSSSTRMENARHENTQNAGKLKKRKKELCWRWSVPPFLTARSQIFDRNLECFITSISWWWAASGVVVTQPTYNEIWNCFNQKIPNLIKELCWK